MRPATTDAHDAPRAVRVHRCAAPAALALLVLFVAPGRADAQRPELVRVDAEVSAGRDSVRGTLEVQVRVPEAAAEIHLWLLPARLEEVPRAMTRRHARWVFPGRRDRGGIEVSDVRVEGAPAASRRVAVGRDGRSERDAGGDDLVVTIAPGPARELTLSLRFELDVPRRFGRFGHIRDQLSLTGPWYPIVVDAAGEHRFSPETFLDVRLAGKGEIFASGGVHGRRVTLRTRAAYVPVSVADRFHTADVVVGETTFRLYGRRPFYRVPGPETRAEASLRDLGRVDLTEQLARVARPALETLREVSSFRAPSRVSMLLVPSRSELAAVAPGVVLLSDRIYQLTPFRQARAFHDRALRRAVFGAAIVSSVEAIEPPSARDVGVGLRAVLLDDADTRRRAAQVQSPRELVNWASFHPAVDQLLYAPQIAFPDVYFDGGDEPFREAPRNARRPIATPPRIIALLEDALGEEAFGRLSASLLAGELSYVAAVAALDADTAALLPTWLEAPSHPLNYRLGAVESTPTAEGHRHVVTVWRDGASRREPIEVLVVDEDGNEARAVWDEAGPSGRVVLVTPAARSNVILDPRHRRVQSAAHAREHPRNDDAERLSWRPPLARAFSVGWNATEGRATGLVDLAFRRRYDLTNSFGLALATTPRSSGGTLSYARFIGRARDTNQRVGFVSAGVGVDRIASGFVDEGQGGVRSSVLVGVGHNSKVYHLDPREGSAVAAYLRSSLTRRDDGSVGLSLSPSLRGNLTVPVGLRGALVLVGAVSWVVGEPLPGERPGLGGPTGMRGYLTHELVADGVGFVVVEQRFTPLSDLALDLFHLAWVRELQLAVFAGAGGAYRPTDGRARAYAAEVGAGVRVHFDYFGIQPGLLSVDVGVPLLRSAESRARSRPVTVVIGFDQYF